MGWIYNPFTGSLDLVGTSGGGVQDPNFVDTFLIADWTGPSGGLYSYSLTAVTHGKGTDPIVQVYELNGSDYEIANVFFKVNSSGDITIQVSDTPDLRFDGKIVVSENN